MAALKYIAIFLSLRSRCRGHISVNLPANILGIQLTVFKICRGASKNKINISPDKAVLVIMTAIDPGGILLGADKTVWFDFLWRKGTCKNGVLAGQHPAAVKQDPVSIHIKGQSLSH